MKITDVKVVSKGVPAGVALVQVETDGGLLGMGATSASTEVVAALIEQGDTALRSLLIGQDPTDTNLLWRRMFAGGERGRSGEGGVAVNAMAAIDMALWDIAGKARGVPVYKLLGGAVQSQVMAYASTTAFDIHKMEEDGSRQHKSPESLVAEAAEFVEEGFKAIKFGWGNYFSHEDLDVLSTIRDTIGPDIELMLDFGCPAYLQPGWSLKDAIKVANILAEVDIYFLEEPLDPYDVDGFAALTESSPIKIATGESLTTVRDFQGFIERRAVDVIQPDAQQIGITQFRRVSESAEEAGILSIPHGPWTVFTVAAHLNVLATMTNGVMIEYPAFARIEGGTRKSARLDVMHNKIVENPIELVDGFLQLSESPGLGLNLVLEALDELKS